MDWVIKNKYWLALLTMSAVNAHFTQYINRFKEGTYIYNLVLGIVTMMIMFMLLGVVIFGLGKNSLGT